jgi:mRNA interferase MazF
MRGDVYLADLSPTRGSEQAGFRPVIVVSREAINRSSPVVVVVPCTSWSQERRVYPSQVVIRAPEGGLRGDSIALGEQVRAITRDRLGEHWGSLEPPTLRRLDQALLIVLDLPGQLD